MTTLTVWHYTNTDKYQRDDRRYRDYDPSIDAPHMTVVFATEIPDAFDGYMINPDEIYSVLESHPQEMFCDPAWRPVVAAYRDLGLRSPTVGDAFIMSNWTDVQIVERDAIAPAKQLHAD